MRSRCMSLLPRTTLHSDSEQVPLTTSCRENMFCADLTTTVPGWATVLGRRTTPISWATSSSFHSSPCLASTAATSTLSRYQLSWTILSWPCFPYLSRKNVSVWNKHRGLLFGPKTISPPPLRKMIFFPLSQHIVFRLLSWPFCLYSSLFCIYFTLLLPLFYFLSPFFFFFPLFCFVFNIFPLFSIPLFIFFPSKDIYWYFAPSGGGGYYPIYRPLHKHIPEPRGFWSGYEILLRTLWIYSVNFLKLLTNATRDSTKIQCQYEHQ